MKRLKPSGGRWPQSAVGGRSSGPMGHGAKTAAVRDRAIAALLSERTVAHAATRAGIAERTLRRWLAEDDGFKAAFDAARTMTFQDALDRIQVVTAQAVDTLEDLLSAKKHPAVRLGAARTLVELGLHRHEADTIERKIRELEATRRDDHADAFRKRGR